MGLLACCTRARTIRLRRSHQSTLLERRRTTRGVRLSAYPVASVRALTLRCFEGSLVGGLAVTVNFAGLSARSAPVGLGLPTHPVRCFSGIRGCVGVVAPGSSRSHVGQRSGEPRGRRHGIDHLYPGGALSSSPRSGSREMAGKWISTSKCPVDGNAWRARARRAVVSTSHPPPAARAPSTASDGPTSPKGLPGPSDALRPRDRLLASGGLVLVRMTEVGVLASQRAREHLRWSPTP
jgi:hypothetical protein